MSCLFSQIACTINLFLDRKLSHVEELVRLYTSSVCALRGKAFLLRMHLSFHVGLCFPRTFLRWKVALVPLGHYLLSELGVGGQLSAVTTGPHCQLADWGKCLSMSPRNFVFLGRMARGDAHLPSIYLHSMDFGGYAPSSVDNCGMGIGVYLFPQTAQCSIMAQ